MRGAASSVLCLCFLLTTAPSWVSSFQPSSSDGRFLSVSSPLHPSSGARPNFFHDENPPSQSSANSRGGITSSTSLNSFMGSDGGLFGIGTPELATILLVGYFVLGPSDLYKLVKEIGKFIQNIRTLGTEATKTFENTMESQLELKEIRKAQQELNDAFSFRRSINVDTEAEVFSNSAATATGPVPETAAAAAGAAAAATSTPSATAATDTSDEAAAPPKRKKKRRRVKKKAPPTAVPEMESSTGNVPDLDMSDAFPAAAADTTKPAVKNDDDWFADGFPSASDMAKEDMAWLAADNDTNATTTTTTAEPKDPAMAAAEQSRFQQQLSGNWNEKVLDNEDSLAPLAVIMEKLALLEEERAAADKRLEDEFRQRFQLEEDYYQKKRDLLEETAAKVQENAYVTMDSSSDSKKK